MAELTEYDISINFSQKGAEQTKNKVNDVKSSVDKLKTAVKGIAIGGTLKKLGETMFNLTTKTADYIETVNLFRASMGSAADEAQKFIDKAEKVLGLDPKNLMDSISSFQNLSEGFGIASDRAYTMSQNLTQLSADLSSFANISFEEAQKKLMSGFSGQVMPLRKYGIALDQATLQETAYSLGLQQRVKDMTRAQKTELIYYQIMTSTQKMQGDLSRSLLSPANAVRVMKNEFTRLARAVGSIFIPILMKIIPVVRAITELFIEAAQAIAAFFGFDMSNYNADLSNVGGLLEGVSDDIGDIGDAAEDTTKKMNKMLMPFDELNNISTSAASGASSGLGGVGGGSLGIDLPEYNMFTDASNEMAENVAKIKEKIKELLPIIGTVAGILATMWVIDKIATFIQKVETLTKLLDGLGGAGKFLKTVLGLALEIGGLYIIWKGIQHAIETGEFDAQSLLMIIGGTNLFAAGLALQFSKTLPLKLGLEISLAIASAWLLYNNIKKIIDGEVTPETILGVIVGAAGLFTAGVLVFKTIKKIKIPAKVELDTSSTDLSQSATSLKSGLNSLMKAAGFAAAAIAVLGGLSMVINSITNYLDAFAKSGKSADEVLKLLSGTLGIVVVAFGAIMLAMTKFKPSWQSILGAGVILAGLTLVLIPLADIINAIGGNTDNLTETLLGLTLVLVEVGALFGALALIANTIQSPLAMGGVLVVTLAVVGILFTLREVLPDILDSISTFINDIGPTVVKTIEAIGVAIATIAKAIGETLPPIIEALGTLFTKVFEGISNVVTTVGNTVSSIVDTVGRNVTIVLLTVKEVIRQIGDTIEKVAKTIIWFIDNLGPAIERFNNSLITTTTRIVNFVISAIEYLVNRIVDGVNSLSSVANSIPGVNIQRASYTRIPRFQGYAKGGFPETGELFYANEAGPELVGTIGNRTAVANKDQITTAIAEATYQAMSRALANNNSDNNQPIIVNIGNEQLYKGFTNYQNQQSNMYGINI